MKENIKRINIVGKEGICDAIGDAISIQDTDFMVLYQNQAHKNIIGEHVGEYCYKAYEKKGNVCEGCPVAMSFKDGKVHTTIRSATTDRGLIYVEITASPLRDSKGEIIAGIEVARDITERKKMEEELNNRIKELEDFYQMTVNREVKMKHLKEEIEKLKAELSKHKK